MTAWNKKEVKEFINRFVEANAAIYTEISRKIWEKPELGMEEHYACQLHKDYLRTQGFEVEENSAGMPTAFVATYGSGKPVIGFSVEYDALPGLSQKVEPGKDPVSEGAPGEGCGHNVLGAGGTAAAAAFAAVMKKFGLEATIKVFGTPAEELCIGKPFMANAGLFCGVDAVLDWHPMMYTASSYLNCLAYFNVKYHFKGRTSHGNSPWFGRSALDAAIFTGHGIEMMREHIKPGRHGMGANTLNYTFSETGPEFPSVVPDRADLWVVGRFTDGDMVQEMIRRVDQCAEGAALAADVTVEKEYIAACHEMIPNKAISEVVYRNLVEQGDVEFTEEEKEFVRRLQECEGQEPYTSPGVISFGEMDSAVTDSSEYSWFAPYAMLGVCMGPGPSWHNWMVTACAGGSHGDKALLKAAQILAASAVDLAEDPSLIEGAKAELEERLGGRIHKSLLPEGTPVPIYINKKNMQKYR